MAKKGQKFLDLYNHASMQRMKWHSPGWRLFVILLAVILAWFAWEHLIAEYPQYNGQVVSNLAPGVSMGERVFSWFMGGLMAGAVLFALLIEGEFILSMRRASDLLEREKEIFAKFRKKGK